MEDWEIDTAVSSVEYERERERLNEPTSPNLAGTPTKKLVLCNQSFLRKLAANETNHTNHL
jgi:hypothetical protein